MRPDPESRMVAIAISFVKGDQCLGVSRVLASGRVGTGVQSLRVKTICIAACSVMYNSDPVSRHRVLLLIFDLSLDHLSAWIAVEVRGVGVLLLPW